MIILITGGVKSGKSTHALNIAIKKWKPAPNKPISFIATAEALDNEMKLRIAKHQEERAKLAGAGSFATIEETLELDKAIIAAGQRAVIDCIPMWINNLIYYKREDNFHAILDGLIKEMKDCIIVTNETGLGNIPFDEATRRYNLLLAEANRKLAAAADTVLFMVSGIPMKVK